MFLHCFSGRCRRGGDISVVDAITAQKSNLSLLRAGTKQLHLLSDFPSDGVPNDRYIPPMQCVSNSRKKGISPPIHTAASAAASVGVYTQVRMGGGERMGDRIFKQVSRLTRRRVKKFSDLNIAGENWIGINHPPLPINHRPPLYTV